jgi:hypothetical protein
MLLYLQRSATKACLYLGDPLSLWSINGCIDIIISAKRTHERNART